MASKPGSSSIINVAWATPVSLAQLGARLMAYTKTKAKITTFRLVTRYTSLSACHNLPEEVISTIAGNLREIVFTTEMKYWIKMSKCLTNKCSIMSHVPQAELNSFAGIVTSNKLDDNEWLEAQFAESAAEQHQKLVNQFHYVLTNSNGTSRVAKGIRIFTRDFGIQPCFILLRDWLRDDRGFEQVEAKAYLTLPILRVPVSSNPGPHTVSFSVDSLMIPSERMSLTDRHLQKYKIATNILNLHPYDPDEDETIWEDKPKLTYICNSDEDTDSEWSDNGDDVSNSAQENTLKSEVASIQDQGTAGGVGSGVKIGTEESREEHGLTGRGKDSHNHGIEMEIDRVSPEPIAKRTEKDSEKSAGSKGEEWPQLMILRCGQFEASCEDDYW